MFLLLREQVTPILQTFGKLTFNTKWLHISLRFQALFLNAVVFCDTWLMSTTFRTLPFSQIPNGKVGILLILRKPIVKICML